MKSFIVIIFLLISIFFVPHSLNDAPDLSINLNGKSVNYHDIYLHKHSSITYINLNDTARMMGYEVFWDKKLNKLKLKNDNTTLIIYGGKKTAYKNGKKITLGEKPILTQGKVAVPLSFLSQVFNAEITQEQENHYLVTTKKYIPVLCYHNFPTDGKADKLNTNPAIFKKQLEYLKGQGYETITTEDLLKGHLPKKPIMITADDGYISNYTGAFPILKELHMKMTIFVIVSTVGKTPGSYPHFTWEQAREMEASGLVDIESHTYNLHDIVKNKGAALIVKLDGESDEQYKERITKDLVKAKTEIEKHLNKKVTALAYPHGAYNHIVESAAIDAGYKALYTTENGVNFVGDSPLDIKRMYVFGTDTGKMIEDKIRANAY